MTTATKVFAADYPKSEQGWIQFPRDVKLRQELFPKEVMEHPAKANLTLVQELARYITEPGDSILDPFGGVGSQMVSALDGRKVVLIELEPYFIDMQKETLKNWIIEGRHYEPVYILQGDCREVLRELPYLVNGAIFSPPYSTTMASSGLKKAGEEDIAKTTARFSKDYSRSALNISRLNPFLYEQAMGMVLKRLVARLVPQGRVAIISKDRTKGPRREMLSEAVIRSAQRNGLMLEEWHKWEPPSLIAKVSQRLARERTGRDIQVVLDEDLLLFRKKA